MFKEIAKGWTKHIDFMILDVLCLEISFLIAYAIRNGADTIFSMPRIYENMLLLLIVIDICVVFFRNSYANIIRRGYLIEFKQTLIHNAWIVISFIVWLFLIQQSGVYSRQIIITMYPISVCIMTIVRSVWKRVIRTQMEHRKELRKILVVTTSDKAEEVVKGLFVSYRDYMLDGVVLYDQDYKPKEQQIRTIPVCAGKNDMITYIKKYCG